MMIGVLCFMAKGLLHGRFVPGHFTLRKDGSQGLAWRACCVSFPPWDPLQRFSGVLAAVLEGLILAESHLGSFRLRCPESVAAEDVAGIEGEFAVHPENFEGAGNGVDVHDAHGAGFALQDLAHLRIARLYGTSGRPAPSCGLPGRT